MGAKKKKAAENAIILKTLTVTKPFLHAQGCRGDKFKHRNLSTEISIS